MSSRGYDPSYDNALSTNYGVIRSSICDALKVDRVLSVSCMALLLELQIAAAWCRTPERGLRPYIALGCGARGGGDGEIRSKIHR